MFTDEVILEEMIRFLEYRKEFMEEPYIICGQRLADLLKEHFESEGIAFTLEEAWKNNVRFIINSVAE